MHEPRCPFFPLQLKRIEDGALDGWGEVVVKEPANSTDDGGVALHTASPFSKRKMKPRTSHGKH